MAGLTVILETHKSHHHHYSYTTTKERPRILVKASVLRQHRLAPSPPQPLPTMLSSSFLQSCYLCRGRLSQEKDIYMYRGDRAFCSLECRRNQILMDEEKEKTNSNVVPSTCLSHHRKGAIKNRATPWGGFAY